MPASLQSETGFFEICFESLFTPGRALVFPCDALGRVDLDALPARALCNYLYARALVGRDFAAPFVARTAASPDTSGQRPQRRGASQLEHAALMFGLAQPASLASAMA